MTIHRLARTALVAGGAGFVGSHLCEALLGRGMRVIAVDNFQTGLRRSLSHLHNHRDLRVIEADVAEEGLPEMKADWIFNLASPASPPHYQADPVRTLMTNVVGTRNLLARAAREGARFLQASTSEVYGDPEMHPQQEHYWGHVNPIGLRACYDEGKRAAETLCFDYRRSGDVDVRVARIFNTYGPRMRPDDGRIMSNFLIQALENRDITVYGDGRQTRSFCYVSDLVRGLIALMAADAPPGGPVNLGNPDEVSVLDLADTIRRSVPTRSQVVFRPLPSDDPRRRRPDITTARTLLDWTPRVALDAGIARTAAWFALPGNRRIGAAQLARPAE